MRIAREDFVITYFGSTQSSGTNRKADTSADRTCHLRIALVGIETK